MWMEILSVITRFSSLYVNLRIAKIWINDLLAGVIKKKPETTIFLVIKTSLQYVNPNYKLSTFQASAKSVQL